MKIDSSTLKFIVVFLGLTVIAARISICFIMELVRLRLCIVKIIWFIDLEEIAFRYNTNQKKTNGFIEAEHNMNGCTILHAIRNAMNGSLKAFTHTHNTVKRNSKV